MPQSGQEMLEVSIDTCKKIADGLGSQNEAWETSVVEIVDKLEEVSDTFFFKTMPSVPTTRKVLREAESLSDLKNSDNWSAFAPALETFIASSQDLIEKAGMKGVTLT
mgnify:CR=1 FL=1